MPTKRKKIAKSLKIFFSEIRKHRALIFGMYHLLVDLFQDCSYDVPGVKTGPTRGSQVRNIGTRRKTLNFFFSETRKCRALIFGMKHLLVDLYQDCSYDAPGVKTGLAPGVTISKHRNKDGKLQNSSFLSLEGAEV